MAYSYVYWGEYPLAFAACLGQEECYRLVLAKGADPNGQDSNGNTVLHMLVIYDKPVSCLNKKIIFNFNLQYIMIVKLTGRV